MPAAVNGGLIALTRPCYGGLPDAAGDAGSRAPKIAYSLDLPDGQTAKVFSNGVAAVFSKDRRKVQFRAYPVTPQYDEAAGPTGLREL